MVGLWMMTFNSEEKMVPTLSCIMWTKNTGIIQTKTLLCVSVRHFLNQSILSCFKISSQILHEHALLASQLCDILQNIHNEYAVSYNPCWHVLKKSIWNCILCIFWETVRHAWMKFACERKNSPKYVAYKLSSWLWYIMAYYFNCLVFKLVWNVSPGWIMKSYTFKPL